MGKNAIKLELAQCEVFNHLSQMKAGVLIKAVMSYCTTGEVASLDDDEELKPIFMMFLASLAEQRSNYENVCRRNRLNGSKHTKKKPSGTQWNPVGSTNESEREEEKVILKEEGKGKAKVFKENIYKRKDEEEQSEVQSEVQQLTLLTETQQQGSEAKGKRRKAFVPPTVEEVVAYCAERGYRDVDAEAFWSYHENRDWKVGSHAMKDWKLAVVTWHKNQEQWRKEQQQRQKQRPTGNTMAERAYRMVHFELENNPEGWKEEARKWEEFKKEHGL